MISWQEIDKDRWVIKFEDKIKKVHSLKDLILTSLVLGIEIDEIEAALLEMNKENHNFAEFGSLNKRFIYSDRF